jgi:hypothetical protein
MKSAFSVLLTALALVACGESIKPADTRLVTRKSLS